MLKLIKIARNDYINPEDISSLENGCHIGYKTRITLKNGEEILIQEYSPSEMIDILKDIDYYNELKLEVEDESIN